MPPFPSQRTIIRFPTAGTFTSLLGLESAVPSRQGNEFKDESSTMDISPITIAVLDPHMFTQNASREIEQNRPWFLRHRAKRQDILQKLNCVRTYRRSRPETSKQSSLSIYHVNYPMS